MTKQEILHQLELMVDEYLDLTEEELGDLSTATTADFISATWIVLRDEGEEGPQQFLDKMFEETK